MIKIATTFSLLMLSVSLCFSWGPVGHETVGYIAEDNLTSTAKLRIHKLLGSDSSLASLANWADQIRGSRPSTAHWHFIDIEDRQILRKKDESSFCIHGDCVVDQITKDIRTLKDSTVTDSIKVEALRYLVHFMGDIHQPLHCADDSDRGGNDKIVRFKPPADSTTSGRKIKLHALWDDLIETKATDDPRALATTLENSISDKQKMKWGSGSPADWAWESYLIAKADIYSKFSPGKTSDSNGVALSQDYYAPKMRNIVNSQLSKAGIRLAFVLDGIFGSP